MYYEFVHRQFLRQRARKIHKTLFLGESVESYWHHFIAIFFVPKEKSRMVSTQRRKDDHNNLRFKFRDATSGCGDRSGEWHQLLTMSAYILWLDNPWHMFSPSHRKAL